MAKTKLSETGEKDAVAAYYGKGMTLRDSALLAHIKPDLVEEWRKSDDAFAEALERARAAAKSECIDAWQQAGGSDDPWQKWSWMLERLAPETFAPPQVLLKQTNITNNLQINVNELALRAAKDVQAMIENEAAEEEAQALLDAEEAQKPRPPRRELPDDPWRKETQP